MNRGIILAYITVNIKSDLILQQHLCQRCTAFQQHIVDELIEQAVPEAATICLRPLQVDIISYLVAWWHLFRHDGFLRHQPFLAAMTFDVLLTLKVVSESCVTWATSVPILVFLGLSVLELGPMYATDVRQKHRLMPPPP